MLDIDRDQAVKWFSKGCQRDERVAASPSSVRFLGYVVRDHHGLLVPLIDRMIGSAWPEVADKGAQTATACFLQANALTDKVEACWSGTVPQRTGVAKVAAAFVVSEEYVRECGRLLVPLLNDPDGDVRREAASMLRAGFFHSREHVHLATQYLASSAFSDDPSLLIRFLHSYEGSLLPLSAIILAACGVLAPSPGSEVSLGDHVWYLSSEVPALLLRLYDEAQEHDPRIADRCLDMWDALFESSIGVTRSLTKALDR